MTDKYSLDLAFSSTALQGFDTIHQSMLTVGYGWAKNKSDGEPWEQNGQRPEHIKPDTIVYFTLYDCQSAAYPDGPPLVTSFEITFRPELTGAPETPFVDQDGNVVPNPITSTSSFTFGTEFQGSTGCNVQGFPCILSPPSDLTSDDYYSVNPDITDPTLYDCTVTFTVAPVSGPSKTFKVDPKMIVGGGGPID